MNIREEFRELVAALRVFLVVRRTRSGLSLRGIEEYIFISSELNKHILNGTFSKREIICLLLHSRKTGIKHDNLIMFWYELKYRNGKKIKTLKYYMELSMRIFNCLHAGALNELHLV